jgi:hypothetical protein
VLTVFALFGDDMRLMVFDIDADGSFVVISGIIFFVFFIELALTTYANIGFALSFFFWLDLIAWLSMITDVTPLWEGIQGLFQADSSNDGADFSVAKNARAARTIRIIRLIRLVRIIKLIKAVQKNRELAKLKEAAKAQKLNLTFSAKDRDIIFRRYGGAKSEETAGPSESKDPQARQSSTKAAALPLNKKHVHVLAADAFNNYEVPVKAGVNLMRALQMNEDQEIEFKNWEDTIRRAQGEQVQLSLWEHKLNQPSQVGQELSDVTIRRVIILVLALLFVFPQLTALDTPAKEAQTYGLEVVHRSSLLHNGTTPLLDVEVNHYIDETDPLLLGIYLYEGRDYFSQVEKVQTEEEIRTTELVKILCTGCEWDAVVCNPQRSDWDINSPCISEAWFGDEGFASREATYNIVKTCCVIAALMIGAYYFIKDAEELVIKPIERMTNLVQELAKNPLAKINFNEMNEEYGDEELPYEIQLLEDTLTKISNLVQMGFGALGAEIVSINLADGEFDPVHPGMRMYGIYGTCNIERFIDTSECLQEDVTVFINILGEIIHGAVTTCGGLVSQNMSDSFLLIWKLAANSNDIHIIEAKLQPEHLKSEEVVVDYFQAAVAEDMAKHRAEQNQKEWEASTADSALIAFAFSTLELMTNADLKSYRDNKKLMRKFEYPFVPQMSFGLHAGWAIQGAIGSKYKMDASFMSADVAVSTYMRSSTRSYGVPIVMSHVFYNLLTYKMQQQCRVLDCVKFGRNPGWAGKVPMSLYTFDVSCDDNIMLPMEDGACLSWDIIDKMQANVPVGFVSRYNLGVLKYLEGNWKDSAEQIQKALSMMPGDMPGTRLLETLRDHEGRSPDDWEGFRRLY